MSVQNIECQLAKGQIGRYLAGDALSLEAVSQLEAHIAECDNCQKVVAEKRAALLKMLGGPTTHAVIEAAEEPARSEPPTEAPEAGKIRTMSEALRAKLVEQIATVRAKEQVEEAPKPPRTPLTAADFKKPLMYSIALAVVLVGMSYASKNANGLFGRKASDALAVTAPAKDGATPDATTVQPPASPVAKDTPPVKTPSRETAEPPAVAKKAEPSPPISKQPGKQPLKAAAPPAPKSRATGVRTDTVTLTRRPRRWTKRHVRRTTSSRRVRAAKPKGGAITIYTPAGAPVR